MTAQVTVRWFAAAGEAAGRAQDVVDVDGTTTTGEVLGRAIHERGERLREVVAACSVLVDGVVDPERTRVLAPGATMDVLPPFAGG